MKLETHQRVSFEFNEASDWYDHQKFGLGNQFADEVNSVIQQIAKNPGRHHLITSRIRRANLKKFPYNILYSTIPGGVRILAIRHNKRRPGYGTRRR